MSALALELKERIALDGPMSVERYMALCLGHPLYGYYMTRDPFGAAGDFVTAPEISQIFGELLGLWCADLWTRLGSPIPFRLVELGPGRGTLLADALRAMRTVPGLMAAVRVHLVETSPVLRDIQRRTLADAPAEIHWHETLAEVPEGCFAALANEFFDALPVRQFVRFGGGWRERLVGLSPEGNLAFGVSHAVAPLAAPEAPEGAVIEIAPIAASLARDLAARALRCGGAALIVDYGPAESGAGDTLQAVCRHAFADPLSRPGETDLTAHVDFAALGRAAAQAGAAIHGPTTQRDFLLALGIKTRAAVLSRAASTQERAAIAAAVDRLTGRSAMGDLFKAIAIASPGLVLAGFAPLALADAPTRHPEKAETAP